MIIFPIILYKDIIMINFLTDVINGAFELYGGVFVLMNVKQLLHDKQVRGIHWGSTIFFTTWGLWNTWYYPHLNQRLSFYGGIFICLANIVWLALRIKYSTRRKPERF